jgi:hypothetical protein
MNIKLVAAVAAAVGSMSLGMAAHAATPALSFDQNTGTGLANPPFTLGWEFEVNSTISVGSLGFFDDSQDGLAEDHAVGLWDAGGTLLASGTVSAGIGNTLINQFRYVDVTPVTLSAGDYFIGAFFGSGADNVVFPGASGTVTTIPQISYVQATFGEGPSLNDPTEAFGTPGFFGPNFTAAGVPEPASWALMLVGFGGLGVAMRSRRKTMALAA